MARARPIAWQLSEKLGSYIHFRAFWEGTAVPGRFPSFTVAARINPAFPSQDQLKATIYTAKVVMQSPEITREVRGTDWFDTARFPTAEFVSSKVREYNKQMGKLLVTGQLTIKGESRRVEFPITLVEATSQLTLQGQLSLNRHQYAIGTGKWSKSRLIGAKVKIRFLIHLSRAQSE